MNTELPPNLGGPEDWRNHYNTASGPAKIEARQQVYWLAVEHEETTEGLNRVDLELETIYALQHAGVSPEGTVVDVGCSFPNFLLLWKMHGHRGRLIGVEPNTEQFNGLPFWQPGGITKSQVPRVDGMVKPEFEDVELYESWAHELPLDDGEADVATMMFMMYHVPKAIQKAALQEVKRVQNDQTGLFALTTRSRHNKHVLREAEKAIGEELSQLRGETVTPPPPVNSGFTSEDAAAVLPDLYEHVYAYEHTADLVVDSPTGVFIVERAIWSLIDKYVDAAGQPPSAILFDIAVQRVLGDQFTAGRAGKLALKDLLHESLFVASDRALDLPAKFTEL